MRQNRTPGSVRRASGNWRPYRDDACGAEEKTSKTPIFTKAFTFAERGDAPTVRRGLCRPTPWSTPFLIKVSTNKNDVDKARAYQPSITDSLRGSAPPWYTPVCGFTRMGAKPFLIPHGPTTSTW